MEIQNLLSSPLYDETLSKLRSKVQENARQSFANFIDTEKSQSSLTDSNIPANMKADNGVKSAVMMSRLSSQEAQNTGAATVIKLTEEEKLQWKGENLPEGIRFCNAGGGIYTADRELDYQFAALYDENSAEDNPVIYLKMSAITTDSLHYKDFIDCNEIVKVEVNKVDPANATYEGMIALAAYIYRDDPMGASEACDAIDMAREYMQADGLDWQNGTHDCTSYYLPEVVRRNRDSTNPANQALAKAAEPLLEYLKDYPRGKTENA